MLKIETLNNIAQVAATIIGFSALISIFHQKKTNWKHLDRVNLISFYSMIEQSIILLIFCYLPIVLVNYFDNSLAFRISSAIWGIVAILYFIFAITRNKKLTGIVNIAGRSTKLIKFLAIVFITICFTNAMGVLGKKYQSNYLILLFPQLLFSVYFFITLISFIVKAPKTKQE